MLRPNSAGTRTKLRQRAARGSPPRQSPCRSQEVGARHVLRLDSAGWLGHLRTAANAESVVAHFLRVFGLQGAAPAGWRRGRWLFVMALCGWTLFAGEGLAEAGTALAKPELVSAGSLLGEIQWFFPRRRWRPFRWLPRRRPFIRRRIILPPAPLRRPPAATPAPTEPPITVPSGTQQATPVTNAVPQPPALHPTVQVEENVFSMAPSPNGDGPRWRQGNTCLVRDGLTVFASGLVTPTNRPASNGRQWVLYMRGWTGWHRVQSLPIQAVRGPCPLALLPTDTLLLSANSTLADVDPVASEPVRPSLLALAVMKPTAPPKVWGPTWAGDAPLAAHAYSSVAADWMTGGLVLFWNGGETHADWAYRPGTGRWTAHGELKWPIRTDSSTPQPLPLSEADVAVKFGSVHFVGVSDIAEPNPAWRVFEEKRNHGKPDTVFRRLYYTWCPDMRKGQFHAWIELAHCDRTGGRITPGDLWVNDDGVAHVVWSEQAVDERLRPRFFPKAKQRDTIDYAVIRNGEIIHREHLVQAIEGESQEIPHRPRFHVTANNRLFVFYYVDGRAADGSPVSEDRVMEIKPDGTHTASVKVPLKHPFNDYFTATTRAGSAPREFIDLLGTCVGTPNVISYARVKLW